MKRPSRAPPNTYTNNACVIHQVGTSSTLVLPPAPSPKATALTSWSAPSTSMGRHPTYTASMSSGSPSRAWAMRASSSHSKLQAPLPWPFTRSGSWLHTKISLRCTRGRDWVSNTSVLGDLSQGRDPPPASLPLRPPVYGVAIHRGGGPLLAAGMKGRQGPPSSKL